MEIALASRPRPATRRRSRSRSRPSVRRRAARRPRSPSSSASSRYLCTGSSYSRAKVGLVASAGPRSLAETRTMRKWHAGETTRGSGGQVAPEEFSTTGQTTRAGKLEREPRVLERSFALSSRSALRWPLRDRREQRPLRSRRAGSAPSGRRSSRLTSSARRPRAGRRARHRRPVARSRARPGVGTGPDPRGLELAFAASSIRASRTGCCVGVGASGRSSPPPPLRRLHGLPSGKASRSRPGAPLDHGGCAYRSSPMTGGRVTLEATP